MKIWILFFLSFLLTLAIAIMMDLMMGMSLYRSLTNIKNPFWTMTILEYVILFIMLALMFIPPMLSYFKHRKQTQMSEKS